MRRQALKRSNQCSRVLPNSKFAEGDVVPRLFTLSPMFTLGESAFLAKNDHTSTLFTASSYGSII